MERVRQLLHDAFVENAVHHVCAVMHAEEGSPKSIHSAAGRLMRRHEGEAWPDEWPDELRFQEFPERSNQSGAVT